MVTVEYGWGNRLGNVMLMHVAALLFAKKFGLKFGSAPFVPHYALSPDRPDPVTTGFNETGLKTIVLNNIREHHQPYIQVHDLNFIQLLNQDRVIDGHYHFQDYFQLKDFVLPYRKEIKNVFNIQYVQQSKEEMMVVVRLGDVSKRRQRLPLSYYVEAIEKLQSKGCQGGWITSDSMQHPDVLFLQDRYKLKPYICGVPSQTINFAKDFNNLVLSEGTYCWWIGLLSLGTNIVCNDRRDKFTWHGDIFCYPEWIKLHHDNPELPTEPWHQ